MSSLLDATKPAMAQKAADLFLEIAGDEDLKVTINRAEGSITVDGREFVYANGGLAMLGYCPVCHDEVPSRRIRSLADIGDLLKHFKPAPHDCINVN